MQSSEYKTTLSVSENVYCAQERAISLVSHILFEQQPGATEKNHQKHVTNRLETQPGNWFADSLPAVQVPSMGEKKRKMHVSFM
jgi:hypothetical protein